MNWFESQRSRMAFTQKYLTETPRWDSGEVPAKLVNFLEDYPPGKALDLGCGTGLCSIFMGSLGWEVVGIDFARPAINRALARLREFRETYPELPIQVDFYLEDVTGRLPYRPPFQFAFDQGCLHSLSEKARPRYVDNVRHFLGSGQHLLLFARGRKKDSRPIGLDLADVEALFSFGFVLEEVDPGIDHDQPAAWYTLRRTL